MYSLRRVVFTLPVTLSAAFRAWSRREGEAWRMSWRMEAMVISNRPRSIQ